MKFNSFSVAELYEINRRTSASLRGEPDRYVVQSSPADLSAMIRKEFASAVTFSREEIREAFKIASRRLKEEDA